MRDDAAAAVPEEIPIPPAAFRALPNPYSDMTRLGFSLDRDEPVTLAVFDVSGRLVRTLIDRRLGAGVYYVSWDGRNSRGRKIPSGVYFCRLETGEKVRTAKVLHLK
jgi:flagellar hook assembly protein FlgD